MKLTKEKLDKTYDYLCNSMCNQDCYSGCPIRGVVSRKHLLTPRIITRIESLVSHKCDPTLAGLMKNTLCNKSSCDSSLCFKCILASARKDKLYSTIKTYLYRPKRNLI